MKKSILILVFLVSQLSSCQILPLNTYENIPLGAYKKDLNNDLLPYIGTWEGTLNNKKYTFEIIKFTHQAQYGEYYQDKLSVKFKVLDLNTSIILYDDLSVIDFEDCKIRTVVWQNHGILDCFFTDIEENCFNTLEFTIRKVKNQPTKMTYCYFKYGDSWGARRVQDKCIKYSDQMDIPVFLPMQNVDLVKL